MSTGTTRSDRENYRRRYTLQSERIPPTLSRNFNELSSVDDPYVRELLKREIDFSKYEQGGGRIELLTIPNIQYSNPIPPRVSNVNRKSPVIIRNNSNQSSFQNRPTRKWIIQPPPPTNSNQFVLHRERSNFSEIPKNEQQQPLIPQRIKTMNYNRYEQTSIPNHKTKNGNVWNLYTGKERRNIFIYMIGLMLYKFGLEAFNGSIVSLAANRYDRDAFNSGTGVRTFEKVGLMVGLNQAFQCLGSILIAPLIKRYPIRNVLSISIFVFSLLTALLMIIDASTGGTIKPSNYRPMHENDYRYYGNYPTNLIIPIYSIVGIAYGMVELIRRIIPEDIVGNNEEKLQRMDAFVHIFYEMAGVSGALLTGLVLIPRLGNNYSFLITPILFTMSAIIWLFISSLGTKSTLPSDEIPEGNETKKTNHFKSIFRAFYLFGKSVYLGGKLIFGNRKYIWLFPCYPLTLYIHRYLENAIAPQIAKRYLQNSEWSQIIVGGSNFGELLGAVAVFFATNKIASPLVWLRLDCFILLIAWYIPFYKPTSISITNAWIVALSFIPFGFGNSGDDVSLNAHIQSALSQPELKDEDVSALSSVMAFLYSTYIILYAVLNPLLGKYLDQVYNTQQTIRPALIFTAGVQITIIVVIVFISTFIPKGSFKLNPSLH